MIAISQRRDVVSIYIEGIKYILEDIPTVLSKANQGLATLEKYRSRLDQLAGRLTALEFAGGVALYDVLSVLQRAELVTRMATEVERYIIELGAEGRLIEMQLEDLAVGVMAERAALVRDYVGRRLRAGHRARARASSPRSSTPSCSTTGGWPSCSATTARRTRSTSRSSPRGYRALSSVPRLPRLVAQKVVRHFGDLEALLAASDADLAAVEGVGRGSGEGDPRGDPQASGGRHRRPVLVEPGGRASGRRYIEEANITETAMEESIVEDARGPRPRHSASSRSATTSSIRTMAPGSC